MSVAFTSSRFVTRNRISSRFPLYPCHISLFFHLSPLSPPFPPLQILLHEIFHSMPQKALILYAFHYMLSLVIRLFLHQIWVVSQNFINVKIVYSKHRSYMFLNKYFLSSLFDYFYYYNLFNVIHQSVSRYGKKMSAFESKIGEGKGHFPTTKLIDVCIPYWDMLQVLILYFTLCPKVCTATRVKFCQIHKLVKMFELLSFFIAYIFIVLFLILLIYCIDLTYCILWIF